MTQNNQDANLGILHRLRQHTVCWQELVGSMNHLCLPGNKLLQPQHQAHVASIS